MVFLFTFTIWKEKGKRCLSRVLKYFQLKRKIYFCFRKYSTPLRRRRSIFFLICPSWFNALNILNKNDWLKYFNKKKKFQYSLLDIWLAEGEFDLKKRFFSPWKQQSEGSLEMFVKVCGEIIVFPGAKLALCMYYILWE